jgi:hypothetical protein
VGPLSGGNDRSNDASSGICVFSFVVSGVPDGLREYGITVTHRCTLDYSRAQLRQPVTLKLGS